MVRRPGCYMGQSSQRRGLKDLSLPTKLVIPPSRNLEKKRPINQAYKNNNFSDPKCEQEISAQRAYDIMGYYSPRYIKNIVSANMVGKLIVMVESIIVARKCFGTNIHPLKGKNMRRITSHDTSNYVAITEELQKLHQQVVVKSDVMFFNKVLFVVSSSGNSRFNS